MGYSEELYSFIWGKKNYEARLTVGKYQSLDKIKVGNSIVFKRSGVSFEKVPVPASEKKVKKDRKVRVFSSSSKEIPRFRSYFSLGAY